MSSYTYRQETKCYVRHSVIRKAVEMLTVGRSNSCCVRNSYVNFQVSNRCSYEYSKTMLIAVVSEILRTFASE